MDEVTNIKDEEKVTEEVIDSVINYYAGVSYKRTKSEKVRNGDSTSNETQLVLTVVIVLTVLVILVLILNCIATKLRMA